MKTTAKERYELCIAVARTIMCTGAYIGGAAVLVAGVTGHMGGLSAAFAGISTALGGFVLGWAMGINQREKS